MRKFFPEAWLWAAVDVDSSGTAQLPVTAPDTITTWELSAFGVNGQAGVGVAAERAKLTVFKDFYVELALPYQVPMHPYARTTALCSLLPPPPFSVL